MHYHLKQWPVVVVVCVCVWVCGCVCVCVCFAGVQEKSGILNRAVVYGLWDYEMEAEDELSFRDDQEETQWWWARCGDKEGYIPRNLLGVSLSVCVCDCCRASVPKLGYAYPQGYAKWFRGYAG